MSANIKTAVFAVVIAFVIYLFVVGLGEDKEDVLAYDSAEACIARGEHDETVCREEFDQARQLHENVAPRYGSRGDCNSDFGNDRCYQTSVGGGSFLLPFMVGYMLAPRGGPGAIATQPLYRPASDPNSYYTASNARLGSVSATGRTDVAKSQVSRPSARTRTVSRGGFGARAAS